MMTQATDHPTRYTITIKGQLDTSWQERFDGLCIVMADDGNTSLQGVIVDQAALYGILKCINNLGLQLISINPEFDA